MKYDEKIAQELVDSGRASRRNMIVWKSRKKIPDVYMDENWKKRENVENGLTSKIKELFETNFFHRKHFRSWRTRAKGADWWRGQVLLDKEEAEGLKREFVELRNKAKVYLKNIESERKRDIFFLDKRIQHTVIIGNTTDFSRVMRSLSTLDKDKLRTDLVNFILVTKF